MSKDGRYVLCTANTPEDIVPQMVDRTLCLLETREGCATCPRARFSVRFQLRVLDQMVACPIWASEEDRKNRQDPMDYQGVQRDTCFRLQPYPHCPDCPNSKPAENPRTERKWFELEERNRRIERELDEEERDG